MSSKQVFHSTDLIRRRVDVILVRPEEPGNVGGVARALENMGLWGQFFLVGARGDINAQAFRLAKHAGERLKKAIIYPSLQQALQSIPCSLSLASTARVGSPQRPHPLWVDRAIPKALEEIGAETSKRLVLVFGPEGSGLTNEEVALCDWVVTIPSDPGYRSLNLAQAVLIFAYEVQRALLQLEKPEDSEKARSEPTQRGRLITHFLELAEAVGFILPGDPMKMRPRLSEILGQLPPHIEDAATLHGFLAQAVRSVKKGEKVYQGRYRRLAEKSQPGGLEVAHHRTYNEGENQTYE